MPNPSYPTTKGLADLITLALTNHAVPTFEMVAVTVAPANAAAAADVNFISDIVANEVGAAGYARPTLTGLTTVEDDTAREAVFDAADPGSFGAIASGAQIEGVWLARTVTNDADSPVWGFLGSDSLPTNGAQINGTLTADGLLKLLTGA